MFEVRGDWIKLYNEELYRVYSSPGTRENQKVKTKYI